jgi:hypothetical protein
MLLLSSTLMFTHPTSTTLFPVLSKLTILVLSFEDLTDNSNLCLYSQPFYDSLLSSYNVTLEGQSTNDIVHWSQIFSLFYDSLLSSYDVTLEGQSTNDIVHWSQIISTLIWNKVDAPIRNSDMFWYSMRAPKVATMDNQKWFVRILFSAQ